MDSVCEYDTGYNFRLRDENLHKSRRCRNLGRVREPRISAESFQNEGR